MSDHPRISDVRLTATTRENREQGLLGFISLTIDNGLRIDGLTLRRTLEGELTLSYPARRDRDGREHPYIRPTGESAGRQIQEEVLTQLGLVDGVGR